MARQHSVRETARIMTTRGIPITQSSVAHLESRALLKMIRHPAFLELAAHCGFPVPVNPQRRKDGRRGTQ